MRGRIVGRGVSASRKVVHARMQDGAKSTRLKRIFASNPGRGKKLHCYVGDTSLHFVPGRGVGRRKCKRCLGLLPRGWIAGECRGRYQGPDMRGGEVSAELSFLGCEQVGVLWGGGTNFGVRASFSVFSVHGVASLVLPGVLCKVLSLLFQFPVGLCKRRFLRLYCRFRSRRLRLY